MTGGKGLSEITIAVIVEAAIPPIVDQAIFFYIWTMACHALVACDWRRRPNDCHDGRRTQNNCHEIVDVVLSGLSPWIGTPKLRAN
jgi:hypothetical protein